MAAQAVEAKNNRPNIVLIMTDQQRFDTIAELGYPHMDTPNLNRLVKEGITFTNCFVTAPSCAPSRASLFTGYYPHTTGITKNAEVWRHSWVEGLAQSGYHCVNIGKMHTYPFETPLGFHERFVVENKDRYLEGRYFFDRWDMALAANGLVKQQRELYRRRDDYKERLGAFEWDLPENMQSDMFVGNTAKWWIEHKPQTEPLFLQIGFPGPHPPFDPIPRYAEPYLQKELPLPEYTPEELAAQPEAMQELIRHNTEIDHDSVYWRNDPSREQLHRMRAYYYANITMIDEKIGEIMQALEEQGYLDNTVIIFTSDHGEMLGDKNHIQKWSMYDPVTRVPMIVWAPGKFDGGRRVEQLCQHFDIAPVIMELASVQVPASWEAESVMPALRGEHFAGRDFVYSEHPRDGILTGTDYMVMIRSTEWKLVYYREGRGELYHLTSDPEERRNLYDDNAYAATRQELQCRIMNWLIDSNMKASSWPVPWR
jgi:arylsulfatase A-like enzyme